MKILINKIEDVKRFVQECTKFECDIDVGQKRQIVDAKSILGVLSLNLSEPITVVLYSDDETNIQHFNELISPWKID